MTAADRLISSLAERLYTAHQQWRADPARSTRTQTERWFALDGALKRPYLDSAREFIASEDR